MKKAEAVFLTAPVLVFYAILFSSCFELRLPGQGRIQGARDPRPS